ncbi:Aste57867_17428 [Aphanomyces stellatus]|uniref:Aste57867_17428 protein n=1 Tax=Aphanomyces stellatus TaxID=120398 RepID=A0A485L804_9STRA|nr:hypothetical protein As57867_017368 [Aphanomyces stellatus]VFT94184.1 Aste57867_17428 [Aphanomyces stellatus]
MKIITTTLALASLAAAAPCTPAQAGVVVSAVKASTNLDGCTKDSGFNWLTFFTTDAIPTDAQASASLASKSCLALVGEANGLKTDSCTLWNNDLSKLVTQDPVAWIKAKQSAAPKLPAACTPAQAGVVVSAVKASTNLDGCTKDSGFNWLTFFTTDAIPTDAQASASLASKSCLALVGEANGLKTDSCTLWNNDLSKLVTQYPVAWIKAKQSAAPKLPAACTPAQAGVVVSAVKASTNLDGCTKDSGFNWLTFFTTDAIPTDAQASASLASKSCLALVGEANGLKTDSCTLWNNDLSKLVTQDPVAWIKAKQSAVTAAANATTAAPASGNATQSPCTAAQAGVVVNAVNASMNLAGCTKDSGFNWLTFFTTTAIPTDAQAAASLASKSCLALVGEANGLKTDSCQLWNNDLSKLVTQDPVAWIKAKQSAVKASSNATSATTAVPAPTTAAPATTAKSSASALTVGFVTLTAVVAML